MIHKIKVNNVEIELTAEMIKDIKALPDEPEFEYPLFMKSKSNGQIVKFTSIQKGEVVWKGRTVGCSNVGHVFGGWAEHTDTETWQPVPYDKERGLWHGQPVKVWNNSNTHGRNNCFYDAINKNVFSYDGTCSIEYDNYDNIEPVKPEHYEQWMLEAYKTLEGI